MCPDPIYNYPELSPPSGKPILRFDAENPRFIDLLDTFDSYTGKGEKSLVVNTTEDGITVSAGVIKTDSYFAYIQVVPSTDFTITHDLDKKPCVEILDASGDPAVCHITYIDDDNVRIQTSIAFTGVVYLN